MSETKITDTGTIKDINVKMSGRHNYNINQLDISLISPYGTVVKLSAKSMSGSAFDQTTFDDEASTTISSGSAPYLGSFKPTDPLSTFDNEEMKGEWTLYV